MSAALFPQSPVTASNGAAAPLSAQNYTFLQNYIHKESGIVLDEDKRYLVESRLAPILYREQVGSFELLCQKLAAKSSPQLSRLIVEAMTTNETLFFRDVAMFDALRMHVLPQAIASVQGRRKLKIWSAAASTGQEAYSLAMLLLDAGLRAQDVEIIGTDLSEQVLERARLGRYVQFEVSRGLPTAYLAKYFTRVGLDWQIKNQVREMVSFRQLDLRDSLKNMGLCDLVLCRNVLIYFNTDTKKMILGELRRVLAPEGLLVLGCAETVINLDDSFQRKSHGLSTFYGKR